MEIFIAKVPPRITTTQLTLDLANILHGPLLGNKKINFHVVLFPPKSFHSPSAIHGGRGALTLASAEQALLFLDDNTPLPPVYRDIEFKPSDRPPRSEILQRVRLLPYVDPRIEDEKRKRKDLLEHSSIPVDMVQFCWQCRDGTLSVEWEENCSGRGHLLFSYDYRELRVSMDVETRPEVSFFGSEDSDDDNYTDYPIHPDYMEDDEYIYPPPTNDIAIPYSTVEYVSAHLDEHNVPVIYMRLTGSPKYECTHPPRRKTKLSSLPIPGHARVSPYVSCGIRLVFDSIDSLEQFRELADVAQFQNVSYETFSVAKLGRFSQSTLEAFNRCLQRFSWRVAFQLQGLLYSNCADANEILGVIPALWGIHESKGKAFTAQVAQRFGQIIRNKDFGIERMDDSSIDFPEILNRAEREVASEEDIEIIPSSGGSLYNAYRVTITPTSMLFGGPELEQSNRVIRKYHPDNHDCFLRVNFVDEMGLHYRLGRDVNGPEFIRERVGTFLQSGLHIASRRFDFLAYSQSALKDHSVWFVKPFRDPKYGAVDAAKIIQDIGNFTGPHCDKTLIYCPARYGARVSQAFTATDAVNLAVEKVLMEPDIEVTTPNGTKYQFTDGVGTMSNELASVIWAHLRAAKGLGRRIPHPKAYQIRFRGSKGMLSVDYKLEGRVMTLRPSMVKFDTPEDDMTIEIARVFDRPNGYFLNRPLIMLLEGLGVPYETFKKYQDRAVKETQDATRSLREAANLMDTHGLGSAYRIPSILFKLSKEPYHLKSLLKDKFFRTMLLHAMNHVLRLLKTKAAIPVPGAWTLVGVADVHKQLYPKEIFAHIRTLNGKSIYLEGPMLISRSPTIHPGDVTIVHAIGRPPKGTPLEAESLRNTVVFAVKGDRPVPSGLGGGDLDGDTYNIIPLNDLPEFRPAGLYQPAEYRPVEKKLLDRPSTMADVADFVVEFIYSDVVGIVASNWLIIADQSEEGIFDEDCATLAEIHSEAVDYPKSGNPVDPGRIPKLKHTTRPDWNAPETVNIQKSNYYVSYKAIGRLFREIDLPVDKPGLRQRPLSKQPQTVEELVNNTNNFVNKDDQDDLYRAIEKSVGKYIETSGPFDAGAMDEVVWLFKRYGFELWDICCNATLSRHRKHSLTEEEAVVGTISEKTSQPRRRQDLMSTLNEKTALLVQQNRQGIVGEDLDHIGWLERGWIAFRLAKANPAETGAQSFSWIALGSILDALDEIEQDES